MTWKDFINTEEHWRVDKNRDTENAVIAFTKYHVELALKEASIKVKLTDFAEEFLQESSSDAIDKDSILNSYNLNNIV